MTEDFYTHAHIAKEVLPRLTRKHNHPALIRAMVLIMLFISTSVYCLWAWQQVWYHIVLSQIVFGLIGCSMFACEHECVHNTAFRSPALNRLTALLAGIAHVYPSSLFRELHFTHHRHTHVPGKDPEISLGNRPAVTVTSTLPLYLSWISGIPLLLFKCVMLLSGALGMPEPLRNSLFPFVAPKARMVIAAESLLVISFYAGVIMLALRFDPGFWSLIIGQVVSHCFLTMFVTAEHNGLPHEGTIMDKTRSTRTNAFVRLMMWNMPYHAEHHAYPAVPFHALPQLHKELLPEIKHRQAGYPAFHRGVLKKLVG